MYWFMLSETIWQSMLQALISFYQLSMVLTFHCASIFQFDAFLVNFLKSLFNTP